MLRSTTHRFGRMTKSLAVSDRFTISIDKPGMARCCFANTDPDSRRRRKASSRTESVQTAVPCSIPPPPSRSWMSAACTIACSISPSVSTRRCRLPLIFLPASYPGGSIEAPFFGALHALTAGDDAGRRTDLSFRLLAAGDIERIMDIHQGSIVVPGLKMLRTSLRGGRTFGEARHRQAALRTYKMPFMLA